MKRFIYVVFLVSLLLSVGAEGKNPKRQNERPASTVQTITELNTQTGELQSNADSNVDIEEQDVTTETDSTDPNTATDSNGQGMEQTKDTEQAVDHRNQSTVTAIATGTFTPENPSSAKSLAIFAVLAILGFLAGAVACFKSFIGQKRINEDLDDMCNRLSKRTLDDRYAMKSEFQKKCEDIYDEKVKKTMMDVDALFEQKLAMKVEQISQAAQSSPAVQVDAQPSEEPAPFPAETFYGEYNELFGGFPVSYLDSSPGKAFIIITTAEDKADYRLVDNIAPEMLQCALAGCDYEGNAVSYTSIVNEKTGILRFDSSMNAWVVEEKHKIRFI